MPLDIGIIRRLRPENQIHYFPTIGSTMTEGGRLAEAGAPGGTVVLADEQTAGIGRLGRSWISQPDVGVYCTILPRLGLDAAILPVASLLLGLAAGGAIESSCSLRCDLRWPNDVLINGKKAAGILAHLVAGRVVAGIGINVNHASLPLDLRTPATSLRIETGSLQSRETLVVNLLEQIDSFSHILSTRGPEAIIRAFTSASSYVLDRRVIVEATRETCTTAGLTEQGFLLVKTPDGATRTITSGGIRPAQ